MAKKLESMTVAELTAEAKAVGVDTDANETKADLIAKIKTANRPSPPAAAKTFKSRPDVPLPTLEAAVQVAALLHHRDGADPDGAYLLRKCGAKHVAAVQDAGVNPDDVAKWACAEARRRSPAMQHEAIVAQRIA